MKKTSNVDLHAVVVTSSYVFTFGGVVSYSILRQQIASRLSTNHSAASFYLRSSQNNYMLETQNINASKIINPLFTSISSNLR